MGFFGALGKILQGKPVFEPTNGAQPGTEQQNSQQTVPQPNQSQPRTIPVVQMRRVECHDNGPNMDVYADIHNDSNEPVLLDKILVLGVSRELDTTLRPGEVRQFLVYKSARSNNAPRGYAEVHYRKSDGDYFSALHQIRARQESDGLWDVTEFILQMPIRDMR